MTPYRCVDCGRVGTRRYTPAHDTGTALRCANRRACEYRQARHPLRAT